MKKHPNKPRPLEVKRHTHLEIAPAITREDIERYQLIMLQEMGKEISDQDAYKQFADLVAFAKALAIHPDE